MRRAAEDACPPLGGQGSGRRRGGAERRWWFGWVWTWGTECPWGVSHRLSGDPGAPAEAEGASVLWIHTGWADPHLDSSRVPVRSCCCRKRPSSDPRMSPCWSRLFSFPLLGARVPLVSQPLPEGRGYCECSGASPGVQQDRASFMLAQILTKESYLFTLFLGSPLPGVPGRAFPAETTH